MRKIIENVLINFLTNNDISKIDTVTAYNMIPFGNISVTNDECEYIFHYLEDMKDIDFEIIRASLKQEM